MRNCFFFSDTNVSADTFFITVISSPAEKNETDPIIEATIDFDIVHERDFTNDEMKNTCLMVQAILSTERGRIWGYPRNTNKIVKVKEKKYFHEIKLPYNSKTINTKALLFPREITYRDIKNNPHWSNDVRYNPGSEYYPEFLTLEKLKPDRRNIVHEMKITRRGNRFFVNGVHVFSAPSEHFKIDDQKIKTALKMSTWP